MDWSNLVCSEIRRGRPAERLPSYRVVASSGAVIEFETRAAARAAVSKLQGGRVEVYVMGWGWARDTMVAES